MQPALERVIAALGTARAEKVKPPAFTMMLTRAKAKLPYQIHCPRIVSNVGGPVFLGEGNFDSLRPWLRTDFARSMSWIGPAPSASPPGPASTGQLPSDRFASRNIVCPLQTAATPYRAPCPPAPGRALTHPAETQLTHAARSPAGPQAHINCSGCRTLLAFPAGAQNVRCARCGQISAVSDMCQLHVSVSCLHTCERYS